MRESEFCKLFIWHFQFQFRLFFMWSFLVNLNNLEFKCARMNYALIFLLFIVSRYITTQCVKCIAALKCVIFMIETWNTGLLSWKIVHEFLMLNNSLIQMDLFIPSICFYFNVFYCQRLVVIVMLVARRFASKL